MPAITDCGDLVLDLQLAVPAPASWVTALITAPLPNVTNATTVLAGRHRLVLEYADYVPDVSLHLDEVVVVPDTLSVRQFELAITGAPAPSLFVSGFLSVIMAGTASSAPADTRRC